MRSSFRYRTFSIIISLIRCSSPAVERLDAFHFLLLDVFEVRDHILHLIGFLLPVQAVALGVLQVNVGRSLGRFVAVL